jgi:tetratricopeptide (TPR) repeat protein
MSLLVLSGPWATNAGFRIQWLAMRTAILLLVSAVFIAAGATSSRADAVDEKTADGEIDRRIVHAEELFEQGKTKESREICESLLRTLPTNPSAHRGHTLNVMSKILASEGDYDRSIDAAQRSADNYLRINDPKGQAHALNNKGIAEIQKGAYAAAETDLQTALGLSQTGNDPENQVQILNNLGSAYYFRGSYSEATGSYSAAMTLVGSKAGENWTEYWVQITKFNQATLLQRLGRYDGALRAYREVEASSKTLSGGDRAHLYANLGTLYRRVGDPYKALDTYRIAQQLYSKQRDADGEIAILKNIGIVYALDLSDLDHAAAIFRAALALAEKSHNRREEMQAHLYLGETLLRGQSLSMAREQFQQSQALAFALNTTEEQWKSLYGLGRIEAFSGNSQKAEQQYRQAISVIEQTRAELQLSALRTEFFADKREAYDALISILFEKNDASEAFRFLEKSRARNFQDRMQKMSVPPPLTLDQARTSLPPATALLEFWTAGAQVGLIWATHDSAGLSLRSLSGEQQARIQEILKAMPSRFEAGRSDLDSVFPDEWPLPASVRHILIVPDAWVSYIPFDLLHTAGESGTLIERFDISYLPSAVLLLRKPPKSSLSWPWNRELVAFGDPIVSSETHDKQATPHQQHDFPILPFSAAEIENISTLARGTSQLFLRAADLKKTFLSATANSAPVLHVSTHAFADGNNPENSRLLFSPDRADAANSNVFLRELYDLDLGRVNLATISACDTERGKIIRGEGEQAFSRALLSAGAASSVTALWRVDDRPTAEFMRQFYYFAMIENLPKAEALRLAKLKFLRSKSNLANPAVWAAFVLNGEGLTPLPRMISRTELIAGFAIALALLVIFARLWSGRRRNRQQSSGGVVAK